MFTFPTKTFVLFRHLLIFETAQICSKQESTILRLPNLALLFKHKISKRARKTSHACSFLLLSLFEGCVTLSHAHSQFPIRNSSVHIDKPPAQQCTTHNIGKPMHARKKPRTHHKRNKSDNGKCGGIPKRFAFYII